MASSVRVVLLNTDLNYAVELRNELLEVHGLKIVAEVDDPAMLLQAVQQFRCDLAILQLDPQPEVILAVAETVIAKNPTLPMIAISGNCDTALILKAMRAGMREYLERPPDLDRLQDVVGKVASSKDASAGQGQLVTVVGSAGGVGATLVATNLA
ncbi:MAG: response regulator, partial [Phycisphaerales bacterium]